MLQKCDYNDKKAYTTHKEWQYIFIAVFHGFFYVFKRIWIVYKISTVEIISWGKIQAISNGGVRRPTWAG